jgi:hypothetical protein
MANAMGNIPLGRWQAELVTELKCIPMEEVKPWGDTVLTFRKIAVSDVVISKPGCKGVRFRVNSREDRPLTFTDTREYDTGTAGTGGLWGTRSEQRRGPRRSLTPRAFIAEVSRLIGTDRAEEIVRTLVAMAEAKTRRRAETGGARAAEPTWPGGNGRARRARRGAQA